jgi:hypothetical protein
MLQEMRSEVSIVVNIKIVVFRNVTLCFPVVSNVLEGPAAFILYPEYGGSRYL